MLRYKSIVVIARLAAIFVPASVILYFAMHAGTLPDCDYWGVLESILTDNGFSRDISAWLVRSNDHIVIIPKILYAINILLTSGSNTGLALIAWSAALAQVLLLRLVITADIRKVPMRGTLLLLIISIFIFNTKAAHNWIWGMSGTMWMMANLFVVATITFVYRFHITGRQIWLWNSLLVGLLAGFCYSTPLALWPALMLGAFLLRFRPRYLILIVAATTVAYLFFLIGYVHPSYHPAFERSLYQIGLFALNFLGGLFIDGPEYAFFGRALALLGIILSVMVVWLQAREGEGWREECAPWLMLQMYALGNGVLSGISRAGFGIDVALSSRYASLPAFFWLGFCAMWLLYFWRTERLRLYLPLPSAVIAVLIFQMYMGSFDNVKLFLDREERKAVAAVSLITGIYDERILKEAITPMPEQLLPLVDRLKRIGHVPFNKWPEGCPRIDEKLEYAQMQVADGKQFFGSVDVITPFSPEAAKVQGWSYVPNGKIRCVAIINSDGIVRGLAVQSQDRPDVATVLKIGTIKTGWEGYTRLVGGDSNLRACVLFDDTRQWFQLPMPIPAN